MKERIQALMREKNLTALRFAEILEVQPSSISHLVAGRNNPNFEFVVKVLTKFPEIAPDWFIMGKGEMFRSQFSPVSVEKNVSSPLFEINEPRDVADSPPTLSVQPKATGKRPEKIILLHSDQTFSVYENELKFI